MFHNTTPDLQNPDQDQDGFFWSQTGLVLRPTVSDHITSLQTTGVRVLDDDNDDDDDDDDDR